MGNPRAQVIPGVDTIKAYRSSLTRFRAPATPIAFLSNLTTDVPFEFKSQGEQHNFNLQLFGCVETCFASGRGDRSYIIIPGQSSLNVADQLISARVSPVRQSQSLHCSLPIQWMNDVREQCVELNDRGITPELRPQVGIWSKSLQTIGWELVDGLTANTTTTRLRTDSLLLRLATLLWNSSKTVQQGPLRERLKPLQIRASVDYLNGHLGKDISLQDLANVTGLSEFHFSRAFRNSVGTSPWRYFLKLRMSHARRMLITTDIEVTQLAFQLGFSSSSHFGSAFREAMGVTPSAFRLAMR